MGKLIRQPMPVRRMSPAGENFFFGYFDKSPWDPAGKRLLAHKVSFFGRQPLYGEKAELGILENGNFTPFAETSAWCWQQGSMLQWFSDHEVIYNDVENMGHVARILNLNTGKTRTLCRPVYCLSGDRKCALSLNFSRLDRERPGYGYPGIADPTLEFPHPDFDGIWLVDIEKNEEKLIISYNDAVEKFPRPGMSTTVNWFNHLLFAPDGKHFAFIHRWRKYFPDCASWRYYTTRMFSSDLEGNLNELPIVEHASHFTWIDSRRMIIFSQYPENVRQYQIYTIPENTVEPIAVDLLPPDGHCSFSPDGRWLLTDSYVRPDKTRCIVLYHPETDTAYEVGSFYSDPDLLAYTRCDLHPRWSQDMRGICFDSLHEGFRGVYVMNVEELTKK